MLYVQSVTRKEEMKKVLCIVLLVLTAMTAISAKTQSCTLTLRAVVEEKTTFSFSEDGSFDIMSNSATSDFDFCVFDDFGSVVEVENGHLNATSGNMTLFVTAK